MRALPTRRRVVPAALMAAGFAITLAGSFGFSPVSSADEAPVTQYGSGHQSGGVTTTVYESGGVTTTTCVEDTTTTKPTTTTTVPKTTTTVPKTTTTVPQTTTTKPTTTVPQTTTTVAQTTTTKATTTTVPVSVLPTTTVKVTTTTVPAQQQNELAVTGTSSLPMMGLGVSLFVFGLILFEIRAARSSA